MIKIYGMITCPDCSYLMDQIAGLKDKYEYVEIGEHVLKMKEFLRLRDSDENVEIFKDVKEAGNEFIFPIINKHNLENYRDYKNWEFINEGNGNLRLKFSEYLDPSDAGLEANPR